MWQYRKLWDIISYYSTFLQQEFPVAYEYYVTFFIYYTRQTRFHSNLSLVAPIISIEESITCITVLLSMWSTTVSNCYNTFEFFYFSNKHERLPQKSFVFPIRKFYLRHSGVKVNFCKTLGTFTANACSILVFHFWHSVKYLVKYVKIA